MKGLKLYDYDKVEEEYLNSYEIILPPNNDGSRPSYSFPIKHQVLRCGKWFPNEVILFNAIALYYQLVTNELTERYNIARHFGFTPIKTKPINMRYEVTDIDKFQRTIDVFIPPQTTAKVDFSDTIEGYNSIISWIASIDRQPKNFVYNVTKERIDNPPIEWYRPYKHKKALMKAMKNYLRTGYEVDKHFIIGSHEPCLCVCLPRVDLRITDKDYNKIFMEAIEEYNKEGER